jgi:mannose-6-phosphate isomerase-like protein (cupin superfamily)
MNTTQKVMIGNDEYIVLKKESVGSAIGYVYQVKICPRCDHYREWFEHESNATYFAVDGALLVDIEGREERVAIGGFIDIPAGLRYRLRSLERHPVRVYAYSDSDVVLEDWAEVGRAVREHAVRGRDGLLRYA